MARDACATASATIAFDFEGASQSRCVIEGERSFAVLVSPEHAPPINPSPWYAFRYEVKPGDPVSVRLDYLEGEHRYRPKVASSQGFAVMDPSVSADGKSATIELPAGAGTVSGQELFTSSRYAGLASRLAATGVAHSEVIGLSRDGRPVEAIRMGDETASRVVLLLGRAHPPEVSGAVAMEAFVEEIGSLFANGSIDGARLQFIVIPLLNPDGVARGHWRANLGGRDLNRDWGDFTQPETRSVGELLNGLGEGRSPVLMVDFHSTRENLFYVQGEDETDAAEERFLSAWLGSRTESIAGYPFTIERRNANPGSGTSKNWFHETYDIPAYTYEVGDETDSTATSQAARELARGLVPALEELAAAR
ncbi:M14 family metallopeptidase [Qipengyuania soli]|uniref:Peptidase M14 domain-containing protein n=1 Tax=Qipengyuania soli TaxID=2782568 RepID=A0A7S8IUA0_9SPHN|nr:M14 family metallopeptidase [Qipengyuania soli]QPC98130.1 hypothetical protein IRL76_09600 [Qipengyuania soli]